MQVTIPNVKIRGICAVVPQNICSFEEELKNFPFPEKNSRRLAKVMGFQEHRISDPQTTPCDLASYVMNYCFYKGWLDRSNIQDLIVVAPHMDHFCPGNSKVIHGQLNLTEDAHCTDIYEYCTGFVSGLLTAASHIAAGIDEVVLITTICGASRSNTSDRNVYPLLGDAASVTVVTRSEETDDIFHFLSRTHGTLRGALIIPAGGCRMPYSEETARVTMDAMGNYRSLNDMYMDGTAVFQYVMEQVPRLVNDLCQYAKIDKNEIQYHLAHQPNRFMVQKLGELLGVGRNVLFDNIVTYLGNSSCSTIPVNTVYNLGERLLRERLRVCFSGFGAGLSVAGSICSLGPLEFCEMIEHPGNCVIDYPVN